MGETFPMKGGDGDHSYAKNSKYQKLASDSVTEMIQEEVIGNLDAGKLVSMSSTVTIADLGCSIGPNTFFTVEYLIKAVESKWPSKNLEFQVLFNDQSANDFNTLLASVPPGRQYHAAGVAGSFHGRIFPRNSITVAHSSHALEWLSKQPQGVPNEGRIHYTGASVGVLRAYSDQFERDFGVFISARAEEVVSGGLMFLVMAGTAHGVSHSHHPTGVLFNFLGSTLMDLANQGVVEKSAIDAFNLPVYFPTLGEMREAIEKNGSFSIERMELMNPWSRIERPINAAYVIMHLRAAMEGLFTAHFGASVVDRMFADVSAKAQEISHLLEAASHNPIQLFLVLKRK